MYIYKRAEIHVGTAVVNQSVQVQFENPLHQPKDGWWLGTGCGPSSGGDIDLQLAPPTQELGIPRIMLGSTYMNNHPTSL